MRKLDLPSYTGNTFKVLRVNSTQDNTEWVTPTTVAGAIEVDYLGVPVDVNTTLINFTGGGVVVTPTSPGNVEVAIAANALAIGDAVGDSNHYSVLVTDIASNLSQVTPTADGFLFWNNTTHAYSFVTSSTSITIGDPIVGGPPTQVLYTKSDGTLFSDSGFTRDDSNDFLTTIVSSGTAGSGSLGIAPAQINLTAIDASGVLSRVQVLPGSFNRFIYDDTGTGFIQEINQSAAFTELTSDDGSSSVSHIYFDPTEVHLYYSPSTSQTTDLILSGSFAQIAYNDPSGSVTSSIFTATNAIVSFDDGVSTTSSSTLDANQFDSRYINALNQTSFVHGDNSSAELRFDDPSSLSQSFVLLTAAGSTMRYRLTPAASNNGIVSIDPNTSSTYMNWTDGIGNTGSITANSISVISSWTNSSTITGTSTIDTTGIIFTHPIQVKTDSLAYMAKGQKVNHTAVSDTNYVILVSDYLISYISLTAPRTVTVPDASTVGTGTTFIIKDAIGAAGTQNITLDPAGTDTIDGSVTYVMNVAYQAITLVSDGVTNWEII